MPVVFDPATGQYVRTEATAPTGASPWAAPATGPVQTASGLVENPQAAPFYGATERGQVAGSVAPAGWNETGGNSKTVFYTNADTGQVVMVDRATGQTVNQWTAEQWQKEQTRDGVLSVGEIREGVADLKSTLDQNNLVGTPGIDNNKVNQAIAGGSVSDLGNAVTGLGGLTGGTSLPAGVMDPIQAAIARQAAIADQMGAAAANYQAVGAPTVAAPGQINASLAAQLDPIQAAMAQAQMAQAAQQAQTALTPQQQAIQAQQIAAAQVGAPQQVQGAQIGATAVGPTALANAATIDPTQQAQLRAAQMGLVGGLQNAIAGKEPSAAEIMLRNATDRNVANQYALAQAANGMNTGMAQRTAMINAAEMNQNAIMQQALLRAQELQQNRALLGTVSDQARAQDIGLAAQQAGFQQQAGLANQGAQNTSMLAQFQTDAARQLAQAQLTQGASQFNAGQANDAATLNAQLGQQAAIANQGAGLQAGTTNATLAQQVALANAAAQNQTYQTNAQLQQAANLQNAQLGTQASIANAGNVTGANTASAQLANAVNLANANNQSQANITGAQLGTQAAIASANNQVSTNALNQKAQQDLYANQLTAAGQAGQTSVGAGDVYAKLADAEAKKQAAIIGGAGAGLAALISDRAAKTDIRPAEAELAEFTSKLGAHAFRYKDPDRPGAAPGQRYGTMVQDLEKSAVGRSLVRKLPDGTKAVDLPQSVGAILATLSAMNKRLERAEAR